MGVSGFGNSEYIPNFFQANTSPGSVGDYTITIEVGNTTNNPPIAPNIPNQKATEDQEFIYKIPEFTDTDTLTYSIENLPTWLNFNSSDRTWTGTPTNDEVGNFKLEVVATDTANQSASEEFTIRVENVNDTPQLIQSLPDTTGKVGSAHPTINLSN